MKKIAYKTRDEGEILFLDLNELGKSEYNKSDEHFKVLWARNEELTMCIDGNTISMPPESIVFCNPENDIQQIEGSKKSTVLLFNKKFYGLHEHHKDISFNGYLFYRSSIPQILEFSQTEKIHLEMIRDMLLDEFMKNDSLKCEMLHSLLKQFVILCTRKFKSNNELEQIGELNLVQKFNLLVETNFREKHKVKEYAAILNVAPKTLSNYFSQNSNKTPYKVITDRIILEAHRLMLYSSQDLTNIANYLGFNDISHFSKFFKKNTGKAPREYKNTIST